ncbi:hypothetical protein QLI93_001612 [Listeria monocytogenes]|nr:hypothetical protein [Listeria monocytogenes]
MAIQFYLDVEGKRYILPVNPPEIKIKKSSNNTTIEVVKLGDVNQLGSKTLADFSISSFFPKNQKVSYINKKATKKTPTQWVKVIEDAKANNKRVRVIVTDTSINILSAIQDFEWGLVDSTGDIEFSISFKEYRNYSAKYVKTVKKKVSTGKNKRPKPPNNKPIAIGCEVIVNGRLHRDSYGTGPGQTEVNALRKVNFMSKGKKCPYHVTTLNGGWRGWVTAGSVKRV